MVHEEIQPNPLEVVLTAQSLYCRYKEAYSINYGSNSRCIRSGVEHNIATGHWQLLIKVVGVRSVIEVIGLMKLRIYMELSNCMV